MCSGGKGPASQLLYPCRSTFNYKSTPPPHPLLPAVNNVNSTQLKIHRNKTIAYIIFTLQYLLNERNFYMCAFFLLLDSSSTYTNARESKVQTQMWTSTCSLSEYLFFCVLWVSCHVEICLNKLVKFIEFLPRSSSKSKSIWMEIQ